MQINFFADKKNLLLLLDWINKKYDNPTKLDSWGNTLADNDFLHVKHVIFKDLCKPAEYEKFVQERIQHYEIREKELELLLTPVEDSFYVRKDLEKLVNDSKEYNKLRRSRIYLCSWYSDEENFEIKKKHYNEIRRFIVKNSIKYRAKGSSLVLYLLKFE